MTPAAAHIPIRIGGMAFGNGVLMRGPRFWAWARADGSLLHAPLGSLLSRHRVLRLPLVRSAVLLAEMLVLTFRLHRLNGRRRNLVFLAWLAASLAVDMVLGMFMPLLVPVPIVGEAVLVVLTFGFALLALQRGLGKTVWRYHGAEHKAVNAYEAGADLEDTAAVMRYSRIHERCGTNLAAICLGLLVLGYLPLVSPVMGGFLGVVYSLLVTIVALEVFRVVTRRPKSRVSQVLLAAGKALQKGVTTREPAPEQLRLACLALGRVVELETAGGEPGAA